MYDMQDIFDEPIEVDGIIVDSIASHDSFSEESSEVALTGHDGKAAEALLRASKQQGIDTLNKLATDAVTRMLESVDEKSIRHQVHLFNREELQELADQLGATLATADLLGRARIRLRAAKETGENEPTDFSVFAEGTDTGVSVNFAEPLDIPPLKPMTPVSALDYFKKLVPSLSQDHGRYGEWLERKAFTLAYATELETLQRVQKVIADRLETGEKIGKAKKEVSSILYDAGISPQNPQYSEMVVRTNMLSAYNDGAWREFQDPELDEFTSAWIYQGIADGRERKGPLPSHADHHRWFNKIFPRSVSFNEVRGTDIGNTANCRCCFTPIGNAKLKRLLATGKVIESWPQ